MRQRKPKGLDKRVYDLQVTLVGADADTWRQIAVSADSTLVELHRVVQGAFDEPYLGRYSLEVGGKRYEGGKGSRTPLRRVIDVGSRFEVEAPARRRYAVKVERRYEVPNRRHYPKVLAGAGMLPGSQHADSISGLPRGGRRMRSTIPIRWNRSAVDGKKPP
jgi:hypothetical protein